MTTLTASPEVCTCGGWVVPGLSCCPEGARRVTAARPAPKGRLLVTPLTGRAKPTPKGWTFAPIRTRRTGLTVHGLPATDPTRPDLWDGRNIERPGFVALWTGVTR